MFDIGVNLTNRQFAQDRHEVVSRAKVAGVNGMLITGTSLKESLAANQLSDHYPDYCWSTAGVHPHDASGWSESCAQQIYQLAAKTNVVAIGECGLDFNRNFSTPEQQELAFNAQLAMAAELGMPLFLHCRDAYPRFIELLRPWLPKIPAAVVHCFTDNRQALEAYLALDLYIGVTGWVCDERRGQELRELVPLIPADKLLLETDAPYLLPRDLTPKPTSRRNEPAYLAHVLQQVAILRGDDAAELGETTQKNAYRLLGLR
ncbi:3'-5' ssDNA/RNA exonuclease TatD [Pragia fontium]|uniref:Sec-independent protein translocase TatD n=1 Tax=Pragia fontium DSM 5563 = ATCC 49100 TaxID=1122977 RepID=A0AAJ4WCB1_9GAMM|nr:3'-5' ssDNA/RNA exonuclease TatD [Pragia fontium]SFD17637.1 Sec-independent protein translocase TatD [Pragia fontium DSM 5563 = ATCC 49100]